MTVIKCAHEWVGGMMVVHPEDLEEVARVRKVVCSECDHKYDPKESEYTVIFDWTEVDNDPELVVVLARTKDQAEKRALALMQDHYRPGFVDHDTVDVIMAFHGDVTNLVAE